MHRIKNRYNTWQGDIDMINSGLAGISVSKLNIVISSGLTGIEIIWSGLVGVSVSKLDIMISYYC